ncbi:MAG: molybdopterin-dependent oxidoreductase [Deltaproteobacteria bacterium]|nr:molybdopterin-dependent oxidoreductase [Deltaproteobacteria bacterium]
MLHRRTCNLCEAMCGLVIEHDGERVHAIRGDAEDPWSRGYLCPKAVALQDLHEDPDRLRAPMRRIAGGYEACSWDDALDETAARLTEIQRRYGRDSVALYLGNPVAHNLGAMLYGVALMEALGTRNRFSATSTDQLPHMLAALWMFGSQVLMPVPDLERTDHLLMLGANPLVSNGSILSAPGMKDRLRSLRARGARLIVVDPRRTETAMLADEFVAIRPGSDALLLAALLEVIFREGLAAPGRLAALVDGQERLAALVAPFTPERVAEHTGIEAERIVRLAREFAGARRAAVYGRVGLCHGPFSGLAAWLVYALAIVTGNLDREGGLMFTKPAVDLVGLARLSGRRGSFDTYRSRVRGLPEFGGELPAATLAEEIETAGEGRIRALVTLAGNPVLSTPNGRRLDRAFSSLDFMVSIDPFVNETTRHAHLVLPPTSQLQQSHYDLALYAFAARNLARFNERCLPVAPGERADWQILAGLSARLVGGRPSLGALDSLKGGLLGLANVALERVGPEGLLDLAMRVGPHGPRPFREGITLERVRREPHGLDLGALEPVMPARLETADRRIALVPPGFERDMPRLVAELERPVAKEGLVLIGRRQLRTNNSWLHNSLRMAKGQDRCTLLMHPEDAAERGLEHGQRVRLTSRVGAIEVPLQLNDRMMRGVVSLPHGFGHDREGMRLRVASAHPGRSINDVTDELRVDPLTGTTAFSGVPVIVEAVAASA